MDVSVACQMHTRLGSMNDRMDTAGFLSCFASACSLCPSVNMLPFIFSEEKLSIPIHIHPPKAASFACSLYCRSQFSSKNMRGRPP